MGGHRLDSFTIAGRRDGQGECAAGSVAVCAHTGSEAAVERPQDPISVPYSRGLAISLKIYRPGYAYNSIYS